MRVQVNNKIELLEIFYLKQVIFEGNRMNSPAIFSKVFKQKISTAPILEAVLIFH